MKELFDLFAAAILEAMKAAEAGEYEDMNVGDSYGLKEI